MISFHAGTWGVGLSDPRVRDRTVTVFGKKPAESAGSSRLERRNQDTYSLDTKVTVCITCADVIPPR
jgi:hypothetical protein